MKKIIMLITMVGLFTYEFTSTVNDKIINYNKIADSFFTNNLEKITATITFGTQRPASWD